MTEETSSNFESRILAITSKVERESRFTRSVVVICTIANLGVMFYIIKEMFTDLPIAIMAHYMESMPTLVYEWKTLEKTLPTASKANVAPQKTNK